MMRSSFRLLCVCLVVSTTFVAWSDVVAQSGKDWICVGGDRGCSRYSKLDQIHRDNVDRLSVAWTFHTGELIDGKGRTIECTPVIVDGVVYLTTANRRVLALDGRNGDRIWEFDPAAHGPCLLYTSDAADDSALV